MVGEREGRACLVVVGGAGNGNVHARAVKAVRISTSGEVEENFIERRYSSS